jgi:hypothetical protein
MSTEAAIQALHAVISQKPHSSLVRKNLDAYIQFAASVERAANAVRDAYEIERRERMAP